MLKRLITTSMAAAAVMVALNAGAIPSNHSLGVIVPATPANTVNEAEMVNYLLTAYVNGVASGTVLPNNPNDPQPEKYKLAYTPGVIPLNAPEAENGVQRTGTSVNLSTGSYVWLLAKYGQDAIVYYVGDLTGTISLNSKLKISTKWNGLSHYTLFTGTADSPRVPDGGTTAILLGSAFAGLGVILRRVRK